MAWIESRRNGYLVRYRLLGLSVQSQYVDTEQAAKVLCAKIEYEIARGINPATGRPIGAGVGPTTVEAVALFRKWSERQGRAPMTYKRDLVTIMPLLESAPARLIDLTRSDIDRFIADNLQKLSYSSHNNAVNAIRAFCRCMMELGHMQEDLSAHLRRMRLPQRLPSVYTESEVSSLINALPMRYRPFGLFVAITGCRLGEACKLKWQDYKPPVVTIRSPKERKDKALLIPPSLCVILNGIPRTADHVFTNLRGGSIDTSAAGRLLRRAAQRAGITDARWHKFRHTAATRYITELPSAVVQQMLGHSSITTTERYLAVTAGQLAPAAHVLERASADLCGQIVWAEGENTEL